MSSALENGAIFAGRYQVVRRIASGGMGAVYEVLHLETERRRALKVMLPHVLQSEELRERFKREAKVAAHIDSEFIVEVFDAGVDEGTGMPFLVMELLRGEELGKRIKRAGRLAPADVVAHLRDTALALDKTHRASIVHRDLKPENLFLTEREDAPPRIKVLDFGVAKVVAESATAGATQSIGTPLYMAPEQFNPSARLTGAADVYALGMVAYTLLAGKAYWVEEARAGNVFALANVAMRGPVEAASPRAARLGVALPPAFDAWFARITALDPAQRFPSATEAVRALADALGVVRPPSPSLVDLAASAPPSGPHWPTPALAPGPATPPAPQPPPAGAPAASAKALEPETLNLPSAALVTAPATAVMAASAPTSPPRSRARLLAVAALAGVALGGALYVGLRGAPAPETGAAPAATGAAPAAPPATTTPAPAAPEPPPPAPTVAEAPSASASPRASAPSAPSTPAPHAPTKPASKAQSPSRYSRD